MKKLLFASLLVLTVSFSYAGEAPMNAESSASGMMAMPEMMYMSFGLGVGTADNWSGSSMAMNAMTMGVYLKPNLAVEVGMDMLPNGTYDDSSAMINSFHVAAKSILPLKHAFNMYGKLGLGINAGQGTETTEMEGMSMDDMQMIMPVDVGPYYGVGVEYTLSKKLGIYLENSGVVAISSTDSSNFGSTNMTTMGITIRM